LVERALGRMTSWQVGAQCYGWMAERRRGTERMLPTRQPLVCFELRDLIIIGMSPACSLSLSQRSCTSESHDKFLRPPCLGRGTLCLAGSSVRMRRVRISRLRGQAAGGQTAPASSTCDAAFSLGGLSGEGHPLEGTTHWVHGGIAVRGQSKAGAPSISRTATGTTCNRALYEGILRRGRRGVGKRARGWSLGQAWLGRSGTPEPERRTPNQFLRGNRSPDRGPCKPANRRASQLRQKLRRERLGNCGAGGGPIGREQFLRVDPLAGARFGQPDHVRQPLAMSVMTRAACGEA
jgi:hypothetical protein